MWKCAANENTMEFFPVHEPLYKYERKRNENIQQWRGGVKAFFLRRNVSFFCLTAGLADNTGLNANWVHQDFVCVPASFMGWKKAEPAVHPTNNQRQSYFFQLRFACVHKCTQQQKQRPADLLCRCTAECLVGACIALCVCAHTQQQQFNLQSACVCLEVRSREQCVNKEMCEERAR